MIDDQLHTGVTRKDGRKLYFDAPLKDADLIEIIDATEIPEGAIACRRSDDRGDDEAWMWDS